MTTHRLAVERAPGEYVSSAYGYWSAEAAIQAAPVLNSVRMARRNSPYTHIVTCENGAPVRVLELPAC